MLGKRPHQIQRTTSMSQLRVPPGARTRPTSDSAHAGKKDCLSQKATACTKAAGAHTFQPKSLLEDAHQVEMKIENQPNGNMVNVGVSPIMHAHVPGHLKTSHLPLKVVSTSPLPLLHAKHTTVESFLDACYFCKRALGHGKDIFMYRGDAAFCTEECRLRQISCDERRQKCSVSASQSTTSDNTISNPESARITAPTGAF